MKNFKKTTPFLLSVMLAAFMLFAHTVYAAKQTVFVPMRDGVNLATDLYLPNDGTGPWPIIFGRTPYGKNTESGSIMLPESARDSLNKQGIAVVIQDVRGRYDSEGESIAFSSDG